VGEDLTVPSGEYRLSPLLDPGDYYLEEAAPEGYNLFITGAGSEAYSKNEDGYYVIPVSAGATTVLNAVNTLVPVGTVEITKTYSNGKNPEGVTFRLYTKTEDGYTL
jgi:hypothetical protein